MKNEYNTPTGQKDLLERECELCDVPLVEDHTEIYCEHCGFVLDDEPHSKLEDLWELFWSGRVKYSGHFGNERKKCVGGFSGIWFREAVDTIEEEF